MAAVDPLLSLEGRNWLRGCILESPPSEIERTCNIQLLNLLCAENLPGNEDLDIRNCLARLDRLTEFIRGYIERYFRAHGPSRDYSFCKYQTWMACLVTGMKLEFGAAYSPSAKADLDAGFNAPLSDASEIFINGMLREDKSRRWGTCSSIPVLITAIARKLGYPVRLACAKQHLYCRWEGEGTCFNIEASNAAGMAVLPDEHYREMRGGLGAEELKTGYYFCSLTAAEEFAFFMQHRVHVLRDAARYDETFIWSARALQFSPDTLFAPEAYYFVDLALKHRLRIKHPEIKIRDEDFSYQFGDLMMPHEAPLVMTIIGHYRESLGELDAARNAFIDACRLNFHGHNEQRDLQRFLKRHGPAPTKWPPLLPKNCDQQRRIKLRCKPVEEARILRGLFGQLVRKGEPLKAIDALHDLYLFDPSDAEVFQRARALERLPLFQMQLRKTIAHK